MLKPNFSSKGFTLVEVLITLGIISITMGLFSYFITSLTISQESKLETSAASFARRYIDTLRSNWQNDLDYDDGDLLNISPPSGYSNYSLTITLLDSAGSTTSTYSGSYTGGFSSLNSTADDIRQIDLLLTTAQGAQHTFSTQIVRPPNE